jgi:hypothetical protein
MSEAIPSDSDSGTGTTSADSADESFDLGGDLDEDLSSPELPALTDSSPAPRTTESVVPGQTADLDTTEIDKLPPELRPIARELKGDYTRKRQTDAEAARSVQAFGQQVTAREQQVTAREQAMMDRATPGSADEDDPFAGIRSGLTEDEARGLDIVDQVVQLKHGKAVESLEARVNAQNQLLQKLTVAMLRQAAAGANQTAAEARQQYPDIDQYKEQVNALTAVVNPATTQRYTPTEAYELVTGRAQVASNNLALSDLGTRTASARSTTATSTAAADSGTGELNSNELSQGLKSLGFE